MGSTKEDPWAFDSEQWAHQVVLEPFDIARAPVTNSEFLEFIAARGYQESKFWSHEGWRWLRQQNCLAPKFWERQDTGEWMIRQWDKLVPVAPHHPVAHVTWWEADAYCQWAKRRLPTEAEWEAAAASESSGLAKKRRYPWGNDAPSSHLANLNYAHNGVVDVGCLPEGDSSCGCRQMIGNCWEWTATTFYPYPGFVPGFPYREQAAPWFGFQKVARGGSWATSSLVARNEYRNFLDPAERQEVCVGFRTCAM